MNKIWLEGFIGKLNRSDGVSIMAIVALMLIMTIAGGVFTSVMGRWKTSAPMAVNTDKALQLANTAATFALQEARNKFYGGSFNFGIRTAPYIVYNNNNVEIADYWFELPGVNDDDTTGADDDFVDDDVDDAIATRYTIIATGRVNIGGTTVAKKQIKVFADIWRTPANNIQPGVHTDGAIRGNGVSGYDMWKDGTDVHTDPADAAFNGNYADSNVSLDLDGDGTDDRDGIVYQAPAFAAPVLDANLFIALAKDQGHYHGSGNPNIGDGYPNGSFYYNGNVPNIIYVNGDLSLMGNQIVYGVYYVNGAVTMGGNCQLQGIVICNSDFTANGGGNKSPNLVGGIIQTGGTTTLGGNGNPVEILINNGFFQNFNSTIPVMGTTVWQEAVSAL